MAVPDLLPVFRHDQKKFSLFNGIPRARVPIALRSWLFDTGSLTQRLLKLTDGDFRVNVLRQYHGKVSAQEQQILELKSRSLPFIREVELICRGEPWVFARSVIPRATENGAGRYLTRIGSRPLGAALFNDARISRGKVWIRRERMKYTSCQEPVWGRQSLFFITDQPLLVSEFFLPACPVYSEHPKSGNR